MVRPGKVRGELIKLYYQNGMNAAEALRVYHRNHRQRRSPGTLQALRDLVRKFEDTGCTCNKPRSGRPTVSEDVVMEVHHTVTAGHTETARGIARVLDIPNSTVRKLLRSVLHMFPFRFKRVQMLEPGDPQQRLDFANEFLLRYDADNDWPLRILWTDEAHFTLNGSINTKNCVHWGETNPHAVAPVPLFDAKVTVWCGITATFVLGPFFFEETTPTGPATCSVTGSRLLDQHFGDRIISRYYPFPWPARSPDLTPMDFWFWGYLKSTVYLCNPQTLSDLKDSIRREIGNIPRAMLRAAILSTVSRMQCVIACDGPHVENV
ncbi:transposable element tc3 transposase [Trichonephila clavipes]|nr:transposable element tc3 transposase [Trichonephila clavipes]